MYDIFAANPVRAERLARFFFQPNEPPKLLLDNYPFQNFKSLVDVGGSHGSIAINVAKRFPNMRCTVKDLSDTVVEGKSRLPSGLMDRVEFMAQ